MIQANKVGKIQPTQSLNGNVATILRNGEEGYTVSMRDFQRAQAIFHRGSQLQSSYIHSQFPKVLFSVLPVLPVLPGRATLEEFTLRIGLAAGAIFSHIAQ